MKKSEEFKDMWRFGLSKPVLTFLDDGHEYISFTSHEQDVAYSTTSRLSSTAFENIMSGTSSVEIHQATGGRLKELVQMESAQYISEKKIGQICLWNKDEYEPKWHTSCFCELGSRKFQWISEVSKLMLQSSRGLELSMIVGFLGFRVPHAEPIVPTPSEFEGGVPYFFEEVSFRLFESR